MKKKICVLAAQLDESTQHLFLTSFITEAYKYDYDVYIFAMHQKFQESPVRGIGDFNVFQLINWDMFDAVVCMMDTIQTANSIELVEDKLKKNFNGPVLMIDYASENYQHIMMDHYTPVKKLINHLIEVHDYKEIGFLGGKKGHPHAVQRLNAFYDSMKEHGLEVNEDWVYHGNFWYDSGKDFAHKLIADGKIPRAIACANDCMAIGFATVISEAGYKIPQDVALVGYDSIAEGKDSPAPLTSADIPASECGRHSFYYIDAMINGKEVPEFDTRVDLYIGESCGCEPEVKMIPVPRRSEWKTTQGDRTVFSDFNHILEDLLSDNTIESFLNTMRAYLFQIEPFNSFDLCLNDNFMNPELLVGEKAIKTAYTDRMVHVLGSGRRYTDAETIDLERYFDRKNVIPYDDSDRDYPTTYIINPVYFDDKSFGYTILNSGDKVIIYDRDFRVWMRNVMQGLEAFYRQEYMKNLFEKLQANNVRDSLTGLYNYGGFIKEVEELEDCTDTYTYDIKIMSLDIVGMRSLNEMHGRDFGDRCIKYVAHAISEALSEEEIASRMCNDEFLIAFVDEEEGTRGDEIISYINKHLEEHSPFLDSTQTVKLHHSEVSQKQLNNRNKEDIINYAINIKNHLKHASEADAHGSSDVADEIRQTQLVDQILNQNLLTYFYQPIVNAKNGSIYAYEALMRHIHGKVNPKQIIDSATYLKRLPDIERLTLLNVTEDVIGNVENFEGRKVFVNSLPGVGITSEVEELLTSRMKEHNELFVVEFTEENEISDERLSDFKATLSNIGLEVAIDDYGVGYSNVTNLLRYEPQYIKIDRALVSKVNENPQKQHLISNLISFAKENKILTLAEGVETTEELRECIMLGVDLIQGYYTGRPQREVVPSIDESVRREILHYNSNANSWQTKFA